MADKRKPLKDINVSVWKTYTQGKEWFFIKPTNSGSVFLVDTALCKQKRLKNNVVDALNYDRGRMKKSRLWMNNSLIASYKNQEYVFELLLREWGIDFYIMKILGATTLGNTSIEFTGMSQARISFKKIDKSQKGEK